MVVGSALAGAGGAPSAPPLVRRDWRQAGARPPRPCEDRAAGRPRDPNSAGAPATHAPRHRTGPRSTNLYQRPAGQARYRRAARRAPSKSARVPSRRPRARGVAPPVVVAALTYPCQWGGPPVVDSWYRPGYYVRMKQQQRLANQVRHVTSRWVLHQWDAQDLVQHVLARAIAEHGPEAPQAGLPYTYVASMCIDWVRHQSVVERYVVVDSGSIADQTGPTNGADGMVRVREWLGALTDDERLVAEAVVAGADAAEWTGWTWRRVWRARRGMRRKAREYLGDE